MVQQLDIEIAGVRIRGEVSAPDGMMVVFREQRNKGHILAVPSRSAELGIRPQPEKAA